MGPSSKCVNAQAQQPRVVFVDGSYCRDPANQAIRRHAMLAVTRAHSNHYLFVPVEPRLNEKRRRHSKSLQWLDQNANEHNRKHRSTNQHTDSPEKSQWCIISGENEITVSTMSCDTLTLPRSPALPASGPVFSSSSMDVAETAQWLFYSCLRPSQAHLYAMARMHWVDELWDVAKQNDLVLKCVSLSMFLKKAALVGRMNWASYFAEKAALIQHLQVCLSQPFDDRNESALALAIAMLAEIESRGAKDVATAQLHVNALARLIPVTRLQGIAWRFAIRVDLRQALRTGGKPILPYWIPVVYRTADSCGLDALQYRTCLQLAAANSRTVPVNAALGERWSFEMFRDMQLLSCGWNARAEDYEPPFGPVYRLAYRIRVLHADIQACGEGSADVVPLELTLTAVQLQTWVLSRYWVSQLREVQSKTLHRGLSLLNEDLLRTWPSSAASISSLLWILTTFASARFDICAYDNTLLNSLLAQTCENLDIDSLDSFKKELKQWPWLEDWTTPRIELVWTELSKIIYEAELQHELSVDAIQLRRRFRNGDGHTGRWFVGGLEFYNSL